MIALFNLVTYTVAIAVALSVTVVGTVLAAIYLPYLFAALLP